MDYAEAAEYYEREDMEELARQKLAEQQLERDKLDEEMEAATKHSTYTQYWSEKLKNMVFEPTPLPEWVVHSWYGLGMSHFIFRLSTTVLAPRLKTVEHRVIYNNQPRSFYRGTVWRFT